MNVPLKRTTRFPSMLALLALAGCGAGAPPDPGPPEVTVAKVISKRIQDWDEFTGRFQAIDTVELRPRASGYIDQVLFHEGQLVKKDDVLVVIDPRPYQADYDRAKAQLALAKAQRELAQLEAERVHKLKDSGAEVIVILESPLGQPSADAVKLEGKDAPPPGYEVVPTSEGKALVDYLLSLKKNYSLPEAPEATE